MPWDSLDGGPPGRNLVWQFTIFEFSKKHCTWPCSYWWTVILDPVETRKLSFHSYISTYRLFALAKTDVENCNTYPCVQTDAGRFAFCFCDPRGRRQERYLPVPRLYKEHGQKLEYECLIYYSYELWPCMGRTLFHNLNTTRIDSISMPATWLQWVTIQ